LEPPANPGRFSIPLNLVQKWLGHAQLSTTAVYANAVGAEEKDIARRMWG
jgi:site-specific recombinase XerD